MDNMNYDVQATPTETDVRIPEGNNNGLTGDNIVQIVFIGVVGLTVYAIFHDAIKNKNKFSVSVSNCSGDKVEASCEPSEKPKS